MYAGPTLSEVNKIDDVLIAVYRAHLGDIFIFSSGAKSEKIHSFLT